MSDFTALLSIEEVLLFQFYNPPPHYCFCEAPRDSDDRNSRLVNKVDFDHLMYTCLDQPYAPKLVPTVDRATRQVNLPYCISNLALAYSQKSQHPTQHPHKRANEGTHHLQKRRVGGMRARKMGGKPSFMVPPVKSRKTAFTHDGREASSPREDQSDL